MEFAAKRNGAHVDNGIGAGFDEIRVRRWRREVNGGKECTVKVRDCVRWDTEVGGRMEWDSQKLEHVDCAFKYGCELMVVE